MATTTEFLTRFRETSQSIMATGRPWRQLLDLSALSLPSSVSEATLRVTGNLSFFFYNYTLILLIILFLSLIYHPLAMIVFLVIFIGWYYLYFSRYDSLTIFGFVVDDLVVVIGLGMVTVLALILMGVWVNVVVSLVIGAALVCFHAALRGMDDLVLDDQESPYGDLLDSPRGAYANV